MLELYYIRVIRSDNMKKISFKFLKAMTMFLSVVLFVEANTNSCYLIYQEKKPKELDSFRKFK